MAFSSYLADKILLWFKSTTFPAAPSNVYISLHSGDPGVRVTDKVVTKTVTGGSTSTQVARSAFSSVGAASGGGYEVTNSNTVQVTTNANASATVTHFGIWSASTSGNFWASGALTSSVSVHSGDTVQFNGGAMAIRVV